MRVRTRRTALRTPIARKFNREVKVLDYLIVPRKNEDAFITSSFFSCSEGKLCMAIPMTDELLLFKSNEKSASFRVEGAKTS